MAPADAPIRIAAALVVDREGRLLLVRKRGTRVFIQPGGKIEPGESAADALLRELAEELGIVASADRLEPLGRFSAPAANEAGRTVVAELFRFRHDGPITPAAEIEEAILVDTAGAADLPLAPLTRDSVLPLATRAG